MIQKQFITIHAFSLENTTEVSSYINLKNPYHYTSSTKFKFYEVHRYQSKYYKNRSCRIRTLLPQFFKY